MNLLEKLDRYLIGFLLITSVTVLSVVVYRAVCTQLEVRDFSVIQEFGDQIIMLGQGDFSNNSPSVNLLCKHNTPIALVVNWRMPLHGTEFVNSDTSVDGEWLQSGTTLTEKQHPPVIFLGAKTNPNTSHIEFSQIGMDSFIQISRPWSETLVSKKLHKLTQEQFIKFAQENKSISFHTGEQTFKFSPTARIMRAKNLGDLCRKTS